MLEKKVHSFLSRLAGGRQYGCSSKPILCHSASAEAPAGDHRRLVLHGARTANSVLQIDPVQAHEDNFLQRWRSGRTATTSKPVTNGAGLH